jgi:hypothetical protein
MHPLPEMPASLSRERYVPERYWFFPARPRAGTKAEDLDNASEAPAKES